MYSSRFRKLRKLIAEKKRLKSKLVGITGQILAELKQITDGEVSKDFRSISPREREVLIEMQAGLQNKEIAEKLGITVRVVKCYASRVLRKLKVQSRYDLKI